MHRQILVPETGLRDLLAQAASAARLVGHLDDPIAAGPLGNHVDAIVHGLTELLGDPHTLAAPVPSTLSTLALDVDAVPEHVVRRPIHLVDAPDEL